MDRAAINKFSSEEITTAVCIKDFILILTFDWGSFSYDEPCQPQCTNYSSLLNFPPRSETTAPSTPLYDIFVTMPSRSSVLASFNPSTTSSLLTNDNLDGPSRRLLKARSHSMDKIEIHIKTMTTVLMCETMRFTVYKLQIRSTACFASTGESTLIKRYSEFFSFRQRLLQLFKKWNMQFKCDNERLQCKEYALASVLLLPALRTPTFPRKHMRCDTITIIKERRTKLQQFVRTILDVYTDISLILYDPHLCNSPVFLILNEFLEVVEEFMGISSQQKAINRRQTAAVLALEDVDTSTLKCQDCNCSICLSDEDPEMQDRLVKLPCSHHFHEDCVINWFNTSPTCPLCRQLALTD